MVMERVLIHCRSCILLRSSCRQGWRNSRSFSVSSAISKAKRDHYEILGLKSNASQEEIRAAFLQLSKEIHPDQNPNDPENHNNFIRLAEAYTVLSKASSRREYDFTLAHRMYYRDNLTRHGYGSHTSGGSYAPGSGTAKDQGFDAQQNPFWDETIWYMRDKSRDKDAFYSADSYYGVKGVKRLPNSYILAGCLGLIVLGGVYFILAFRYSSNKRQQWLDELDRKNLSMYNKTRDNARKFTKEEQIQKLLALSLVDMEKYKTKNSNTGTETEKDKEAVIEK